MPRLPDMSRLPAGDEGGVNSGSAEAGVNDVAGHGGERDLECEADVGCRPLQGIAGLL